MNIAAQGSPARKFRFPRLPVRLLDFALALAVTAAAVLLFAYSGIGGNTRAGFAFLQNIELRSLDFRFAFRGERVHDDRIVIVDIDDATLQKLGSFPIPRVAYAQLVERLHTGGARVVAFDATFPTVANKAALAGLDALERDLKQSATAGGPELHRKVLQLRADIDQDAQFAAAIKQAGNVVLGHVFLDAKHAQFADQKLQDDYYNIVWGKAYPQILPVKKNGKAFDLNQAWQQNGTVGFGVEANIAKLAEAAASYGFLDIRSDTDGTLRHATLIERYRDQDFFPPLAMETVRQYDQIPDQDIVVYIAENGIERIQFGKRELRPGRDGTVLINYAGPYGTYKHVSMSSVLDGSVPPESFRDKIVLLGATAQGIGDLRNTPFQNRGAYMGVEVHANIIDNLLHYGEPARTFLTRGIREEGIDLGFILLFGLGVGYLCHRLRPLYATITVVITLMAFTGFVYFAFTAWGRWLSFVIPAGTLIATYASIISFRTMFEEREKRKIRKTFGQYLSPGVIALIDKDPERYIRPGGDQKELSVMFTDIRGFTTLSEGMTPSELVEWLNEYLSAMTDILFRNQGTLDKYIGDAIMAFWGSPYPQEDHAVAACRCGLEMNRRLDELNKEWHAEGKKEAAMGVGINTGPVNVGNMGSAKRLSWTVMGDNVNLASRLEGLTKEYHIRTILSEGTYVQVKDHFVCREVDKIRVKGKLQPVTIYELLDDVATRPQYADRLARFDEAMLFYRRQEWQEAAAKFADLLTQYADDGPSQVFLQRALEFQESAPAPDWDGVYVMKTK
jgi:adenylate cyclase